MLLVESEMKMKMSVTLSLKGAGKKKCIKGQNVLSFFKIHRLHDFRLMPSPLSLFKLALSLVFYPF